MTESPRAKVIALSEQRQPIPDSLVSLASYVPVNYAYSESGNEWLPISTTLSTAIPTPENTTIIVGMPIDPDASVLLVDRERGIEEAGFSFVVKDLIMCLECSANLGEGQKHREDCKTANTPIRLSCDSHLGAEDA